MKRLLLIVISAFVLMVGCQSKETASSKRTLDDSNLTLPKTPKEVNPKQYNPVSLDTAKKVIPFTAKFPANIPEGYKPIEKVDIEDWGKKEKIAMEMRILPKDPQQEQFGIYTLRIANFPDVASSIIDNKDYKKTMELKNRVTVYCMDSSICWKENGLDYYLDYIQLPQIKDPDKLEKLIDMANNMK